MSAWRKEGLVSDVLIQSDILHNNNREIRI